LVFSPDGLAKRGLLLRHLVMPGLVEEGKAILDWVVQELGRCVHVAVWF
jgi:putative pyruvate formate lyase activating enzyme